MRGLKHIIPLTQEHVDAMPPPPNEPPLDYGGVVRVLDLRPGDALVLELDYPVPAETIERWRDDIARRFPGHQVLVLQPGTTLSVLRPEGPTADG